MRVCGVVWCGDGLQSGNVLLMRAELVSFWMLMLDNVKAGKWAVKTHQLLYPNPYPKPRHIKARWHGHACFPFMLQVR